MTPDQYPVYQCKLVAETDGIREIALVDTPAIEVGWVMLKAQDFLSTPTPAAADRLRAARMVRLDAVKHELTGPLVIPDQLIYRVDPNTGSAYYITFTADDIRAMRDRFMETRQMSDLNIMHSSTIAPAHLVEWWIVDDNKGAGDGFEDLPTGTLMISVKIKDDAFWAEQIATQRLRGFSLEGQFSHEAVKAKTQEQTFSQTLMSIYQKFTSLLGAAPKPEQRVKPLQISERFVKMTQESLAGQKLSVYGDDGAKMDVHVSAEGKAAQFDTATLAVTPLQAGRYKSDRGWLIVEEGKPARTEQMAAVPYKLKDSNEMLVVDDQSGMAQLVTAEGAEPVTAPDKDYTLEDGTVMTVQGGKVTAINGTALAEQPEGQQQPQQQAQQQPQQQAQQQPQQPQQQVQQTQAQAQQQQQQQPQQQAEPNAVLAALTQLQAGQADATRAFLSIEGVLTQMQAESKAKDEAIAALTEKYDHVHAVLSQTTAGQMLNLRSQQATAGAQPQKPTPAQEARERTRKLMLSAQKDLITQTTPAN